MKEGVDNLEMCIRDREQGAARRAASPPAAEAAAPGGQTPAPDFPAPPARRAPEKPAAPEKAAPAASSAELARNAVPLEAWPEILRIVKNYSATISAAFTGSSAYVSGDYVLIDAPREVAFELLRKSSQRGKMRDACLLYTS